MAAAAALALAALGTTCLKVSLQDGFPCSSDGRCPSPYRCVSGGCYSQTPSVVPGSGGASGAGGGAGSGGTGGIAATGGSGGGGGGNAGAGGVPGADAGLDAGGGTSGSGGAGTGGTAGSGGGAGTGGTTGSGGSAGTGGTTGAGGGAGGNNCTSTCSPSAAQCQSATTLKGCGTVNGCPALTLLTCAGSFVCERTTPNDCVDPQWAEWPMPNGTADVAAGAPHPESYTTATDVVTDNVTSLMWQRVAPDMALAWSDAIAYCAGLNLGGYTGWRLPSLVEMISIQDYSLAVTFPAVFSAASGVSGTYWTSSPSPQGAWVAFDNGGAVSTTVDSQGNVRCTR